MTDDNKLDEQVNEALKLMEDHLPPSFNLIAHQKWKEEEGDMKSAFQAAIEFLEKHKEQTGEQLMISISEEAKEILDGYGQ